METKPQKPSEKTTPGSKSYTSANKDLNTEMPLSEKDEEKKAEERIAKSTKKLAK